MEPVPMLSREAYLDTMRAEMENLLNQVADAVNAALPGQVIAGSEEQVRDLFATFRRRAYEKAIQMRVDAAEAAFPPSGRPADRQAPTSQGPRRPSTVHGQ
jgi:hypothetical protein